jgi:hypothetical protein
MGGERASTLNVCNQRWVLTGAVVLIWLLFIVAVFLPDIGRGFVKDDFAWIATGRAGLTDIGAIVRPRTPGFYRPLVAASFALNYRFFGLNARDYGIMNLALYALCAVAIGLLIRQIGMTWAAAVVGAFVWAVNPHGIGMAVIWISGRTSLLLTLCSTLAAVAFLRRQRVAGVAMLVLALLSKEEAVALPLMIGALFAIVFPARGRDMVVDIGLMAITVATYLTLRSQTPAFTFATAPWFYQPTTDARLLVRNALEYLDRGVTIGVIVGIVACAAFAAIPLLTSRDRRVLVAATVWFLGGFALTVWIPVRSSLYAVFPSVGTAIAIAVVVDALRRTASRPLYEIRFTAALAVVLLLAPMYRIRNAPWVEAARVSNRTMRVVLSDLDSRPGEGLVVFEDEAMPISTFGDAFGTLSTEALQLFTRRPLRGVVLHPEERLTRANIDSDDLFAYYRLDHGRVVRVK